MKEPWRLARDRRELAIMQSNDHHPLNKAASDHLAKMGTLPPFLYAIVLIQYGIDETLKKANQTPSWLEAVEEKLCDMGTWVPERVMRYLTRYQDETNDPTGAVELVQQAETPLDAAIHLIQIVEQNLIASGVEIAPSRPWA